MTSDVINSSYYLWSQTQYILILHTLMAFKSSEFTGRPPVVSVPNSFFLLPTYENCAESEKKTQNRLSRKLYFTSVLCCIWCTDIRSHGHSFSRDFWQGRTFVLTSNDHPGHSCSHQFTTPDIRAHIKLPPGHSFTWLFSSLM